MKQKKLFPIILIICLCFLPFTAFSASPAATLTADGVLIDTYSSPQEAVNAVATTTGSNFIIEIAAGEVSDALNILQLPNKNVVIRPQSGASVVFTNTITIDGNGHLDYPETLLIQGFSFDFTSGTYDNCIYFNLIPPRQGHCYPHNITINGCTFAGIPDKTVAVQSVPNGSRNIAIMNCYAEDMHSLAQLKAVSGYAFIQNCTLVNASGGVNFYGIGNLIIDSCQFDVEGYAVRSGQGNDQASDKGSVTINNSVLNSNSASVGSVVLRGDSTRNINIVHSNITNAAPGGAFIQNINAASFDLYNINFVESNLSGEIAGINLATITTIDDPNVKNGPVSIIIQPSDGDVTLLIAIFILLVLILLTAMYLSIASRRRENML